LPRRTWPNTPVTLEATNVAGLRSHRNRGRNSQKNQKWRGQKAAANPKNPRQKAHKCAEKKDHFGIHRHFSNR